VFADPEFRLFDPCDQTHAEWIPIKSLNLDYVKADG
jgi:hypothetical protein